MEDCVHFQKYFETGIQMFLKSVKLPYIFYRDAQSLTWKHDEGFAELFQWTLGNLQTPKLGLVLMEHTMKLFHVDERKVGNDQSHIDDEADEEV